MRVVFAKYEQEGKEHIFYVPYDIKEINPRDILAVTTVYGLALVEATTSIQECDDITAIKLDSYLQLNKVYCKMPNCKLPSSLISL